MYIDAIRPVRRPAGFTLVEIMIVMAIIGMLAAIAIPNFVRARSTTQMNSCISNLRQIDGAIQQWAMENKKEPSAVVTVSDITSYLKTLPTCPSGGTFFTDSYSLSTVSEKPVCQKAPGSHTF